ncbi:MAG: hypothetical protein H6807_17375 [Planctomycetes bacterium]|nr:hypothetical protein [Planctomycetota bacterium]
MNQVARVFLVLNLLLSAGFLMAAATFLHQTQDWKKQYGDKNTELETQTDLLNNEIAKRDSDIKRLNDDINSREGKINSLTQELADEKGRKQSAEEQKNQTQRSLENLQKALNNASQKLAELTDANKGYEALIERYRSRSEEAQDTARQAETARSDAVKETEDRDSQINDLNNQLGDLQKQLGDISTELSAYKGAYPPPTLKNQPRIDGMVIRYDADANMVQVNKGRMDGVALGHMFDIVRGSDFVGTVRITYLDDKTSIGHVQVKGLKGLMPVSGDVATKLASN